MPNEPDFDFMADLPEMPAIPEPPLEPEIIETVPVPAVPKMDIQPVALSLVPYQQKVDLMVQEAKAVIVNDEEGNTKATAVVASHTRLYKLLEEARKVYVGPYNEHVKAINNLFKTLTDKLDPKAPAGTIALVKRKMAAYVQQQELERRRKEAELREQQRQLQAKIDAEAKAQREEAEAKAEKAEAEKKRLEAEGKLDEDTKASLEQTIADETAAANAPTPQAPVMLVPERTATRTAEGVSFAKFRWVCRITAPAQVPRDYCEPSQKLLDAAVKDGVRAIAGCEIKEEPIINVRA